MHLAVAVYAIEFFLLVSVIAIVVMASITFATAAQSAEIADMYPTAKIEQTTDDPNATDPNATDPNASVSTSADNADNKEEPDKADDGETKKPKVGVGARVAAVIMIIYGVLMLLAMVVIFGIINYSLIDYYLSTFKCKEYGIRGLGRTLVRGGISKVLVLNVIRTLLGFALLLCLIVPGVIYLIRTSMANHLLVANPKMKAKDALAASNKVMSGKTGGYFTLMISFIGWYALGILSLGMGFIFVMPYVNLTKTVYYKRNLQGDKTVYTYVPQPEQQQPVMMAAQPLARTVSPPLPQEEVTVRPEAVQGISPIDTLGADELREIDETMRDVGGRSGTPSVSDTAPEREVSKPIVIDQEPQPVSLEDIPEIPIYPVSAAKGSQENRDDRLGSNEQGNSDERRKIDGSDIVEQVRELSQTELDASDVYDQKVKNLYDNTRPKTSPSRNYFGTQMGQKPDDFVTSEVAPIDDDASDSVMDDASFAEFLQKFDRTIEEERKEEASSHSGTADRPAHSGSTADRQTYGRPTADRPAHTGSTADRQSYGRPTYGGSTADRPMHGVSTADRADRSDNSGFSTTLTTRNRQNAADNRTDRARREREERMRNLRK